MDADEKEAEALRLLTEVCPDFASATMVIRDAAGRIVGYGSLHRAGSGLSITVSAAPSGVQLLSPVPQHTGG